MKSIRTVQWYKHADLEQIAAKIHKQFDLSIPVDIDYLVEKVGLEIRDFKRLKEDFNLYGLLAKIKGKFVIFVQQGDLNLTNYLTNGTIAEEFAHYVLHRNYFSNVSNLESACEFYINLKADSEMKMEFDAKYLAGAILIPADHLKKEATSLFSSKESDINKIIKSDNDDKCDLIIAGMATFLSDTYRVSEGVIAYRLKSKSIGFKEFLEKRIKQKCE